MKQEYALKEYVNNMNYGKVINGSLEILNNCNLTGAEAEAKIITLFGSVDNFKQCVTDMINNHTRYFYHIGSSSDCNEIKGLTWQSSSQTELDFIFDYSQLQIGKIYTKKIIINVGINSHSVIIQDISTDDKLKTMFADITENPNQDLNNVNGFGIMSNPSHTFATSEHNYPIKEAGTLFYGDSANGSSNQIYGSYFTNRWFVRGGNDGPTQKTSWREFAFKDDIDTVYVGSGSIDNLTAAGEYVISPDVTNDPFTDYCWLKVMGLSDIVQILIRYQTLEIAIRSKINGSWSSWKYITTSDNLSIITKVTTAQYNASSKAANTAYFVTD